MEYFKQIPQNAQHIFVFSLLFYPCFMMSSVNSPEVLGNSVLPQIDDWPKGCFCYILGGLHIKLFPEHPHCHEEDTTNGT